MKFKAIFGVFFTFSILGLCLCFLSQKIDYRAKIAVLGPQKSKIAITSTVQELASQGTCVAEALKADLSQNYTLLLRKLQNAYPFIDQNIWQQTFDIIDSAINQDTLITKNPVVKHKKSDHKLVKMAREILASCNINPDRVTIRIINNPTNKTPAATNQGLDNKVIHELELNIPELEKQPADIQEAIIRHESVHMLNYDPLMRSAIKNMLLEQGIASEIFLKEPALLELYQYQELRADLLAACHNIDTAYSLQKDFEITMKACPQDQDPAACTTHPTDQARHKAVTQLISYLEAESSLKFA